MSQEELRRRFQVEMQTPARYSFTQKLRAFTYHVYMCILGPLVNKQKYNRYMGVFHEFTSSKKQ